MKRFKKIVTVFLIVVILIVIGAFGFVRYISRKALPDYNEKVQLSGLIDEVKIYRDEQAVPHITAKNSHDLYLTVGYLMAQDRLWQMDLLRRVTLGRLSEIFGKDMADADHLLRALRMSDKSALVLERSDEELLSFLEAFTSGVNQFIETHQKNLPIEFTILGYKPEPWKPLYTINLIGYMAWDLSGSWQNEIILEKLRQKLSEEKFLQLIPDLNAQTTSVYPSTNKQDSTTLFSLLDGNRQVEALGLEIFSGSNNWAVSPKKSTNGNALLANDMHLGFGAPGIWYQMHQHIEGEMNVTGVTLPGAPFVINGHNEKIAWGMTNLYVDEMDFYREKINPDNENQYFYNGEWHALELRKENIFTKDGDTIIRETRFTHRGPIISDFKKIKGQAISMRWTGNEYSNELSSIYLLNKAENWNDFRAALSTMGAVSQNVVYADVDGNIGMQSCGAVPMRKDGNGVFVYPGETDQYDWAGMLDFDLMPNSYNPPEGFVSSANNRTAPDDYPYYIGRWFDISCRIDRIRELLTAKEKLDIDDFKSIQLDQKSKFVERYRDDLTKIISESNQLNEQEQTIANQLKEWNLVLTTESTDAPVFEEFYLNFLKNTLQDEITEPFYKELSSGLLRQMFDHLWTNRGSSWIDNTNTPDVETFEMIVIQSFKETVGWLNENYSTKSNSWKWGKMHQLTLKHPLGKVKILDNIFDFNRGPLPVGGSFHTVNPTAYSVHQAFGTLHGASQRHIFNTGDWSDSYVVIPTGTSGIPASKYYCNQMEMFVDGKYRKDLWNQNDIESKSVYNTTFSPK